MKRVLLTGAEGNLGQALQRADRSFQWVSLTKKNWSDLNQLLDGVDLIVHAASDLKTPATQSPTAVLDANVMTTARLLEAAREHKIKRFIFISSCAVYGQSQVTTETTPLAPISLNGLSKAVGERVVEDFCRANKIEWESYRLFNSYGGMDRFSILSHMQRAIQSDQPFLLNNNGLSQRDFIHIDDVAKILIRLINKAPKKNCLNIGSGKATRIRDIVDIVKARFPSLQLGSSNRYETEYSRGDIALLKDEIGDYKFRDVLDFVKTEWNP